jgi:predicted ATP-grasp superfamily ATP-dependent carboligase
MADMRILVTSSRMPCAIDEIRKLGERGHTVIAADTFAAAPGSHSRHVAIRHVTASPRRQTRRFLEDVAHICDADAIDLVLPAFEEAFYLARHPEAVGKARLFLPPFSTLATMHDKASMLELARSLGVRVPRSTVVTDKRDLGRAIESTGEYFARPVYSRGGVELLTNTGPLAGALDPAACEPAPDQPWIVQEYIHGLDVCTLSIAHRGRIAGHAAYVHPRELEHAGGIVFESVDDLPALEAVQRIVAATRYDGQVSFDFMRTGGGPVLIECNPRPTAGVHVMSAELFEAALLDEAGVALRIAPAGVRRKYSVALVRDLLLHPGEAPEDLRHLFSAAKEVVADPEDWVPALYQFISYGHVMAYRREMNAGHHKRTDLMAAYFDDICWNGEPIE